MKIPYTPIPLELQQVTDFKESYIELFEKYLTIRMQFEANEPKNFDDADACGWHSVVTDVEINIPKKKIIQLMKSWAQDANVWKVLIMTGEDNVDFCFYDEIDALRFYGKLKRWLFSGWAEFSICEI